MLMKLKTILIFFIFFIVPTISIADEKTLDDTIDINNILEASSSNTFTIPNINARYAIVLDRASKTTLYGKNETSTCKMASTTKIMTAIIVLEENSDLNAEVIVSKKAARYRWFKIRPFKR